MVLTNAQTTAFFQNANQMAIPVQTVAQLHNEGITTVPDLVDFDKDSLRQIADNLRRPGGRIQDPNDPNSTIPTPPFVFGAKSQMRLEVACHLIRFYETVGRPLTAANISWEPVMRRFGEIWKSLVKRKAHDDPVVPLISRALPVMRWTESFRDHLHRCIGSRHIPLAYVIRENVVVPMPCPALDNNQPYSEVHGSVEEDLINRADHTHGLYREDNALVYFKLEEATRGTAQADTISPYQKKKDGRAAYLALLSQYAGSDKWEAILKNKNNMLNTRKWKGTGNFPLESFIQLHRAAFVSMKAASQHVDYQLPNEHTRVTYLLDAIECSDAKLQAAMASVEEDDIGKRIDFEKAATALLPKDPVAKKRQSAKRPSAEISNIEGTATDGRAGIGKSGVHYRYYKPEEYDKLNAEQKRELAMWRVKNPIAVSDQMKGSKKRSRTKGKGEPNIAALVKTAMAAEKKKEAEEDESRAEQRSYIMSLLANTEEYDQQPTTDDKNPKKGNATTNLSSILKKAKK